LYIEVLDPVVSSRWKEFIKHSPRATIFHHPGWIRALATTYRYKPLGVVAIDDANITSGGIPFLDVASPLTGRRLVSLPFTDHCNPLYRDDEAKESMLREVVRMGKGKEYRYVEIRAGNLGGEFKEGSPYAVHQLAMGGTAQSLFKSFDQKSVQWGIKKAVKMGVQIIRSDERSVLDEFIRLNAMTRRKHGIFPQPDRFFEAIREYVMEPGFGFVGAARVDGRIVAASVFLHFNGTVFYKYNASDPSYHRYQPNNLILWDAMQWALDSGIHTFDFGRSELSNTGLLEFKRRWATNEQELKYSYVPAAQSSADEFSKSWKMEALHRAARITPSRLARIIGGVIYRHAG
jgi:CelD/BcsL family acetyltransferase involved in cellulose biosynthesis